MATQTNCRFPVLEAARLASLGGVERDLRGALATCDLLLAQSPPKLTNLPLWEALSCAVVVRYSRCFVTGVRESLDPIALTALRADFAELHDYLIMLRNKHIAHSVNAFEENDVVLQISSDFNSSAEIYYVGTAHSRHAGLSLSAPPRIREHVAWLHGWVQEEMRREGIALLPAVRRHSLEELLAFGPPQLDSPPLVENPTRRRPRP